MYAPIMGKQGWKNKIKKEIDVAAKSGEAHWR